MTDQEEKLLFFDDYLKSIGLDYMIFASTLLGIVREGKLLAHDHEVDFCIVAEDLTADMLEKLKAGGYFVEMCKCRKHLCEIYLSKGGGSNPAEGMVAVSPLWLKDGECYINPIESDCIVMAPECHDKSTWGEVEYLGRKFKCPGNPEKWLEAWYGSDWRTPLSTSWHDNVNRRKMDIDGKLGPI